MRITNTYKKTKTCIKCLESLSIKYFYTSKKSNGYFHPDRCKKCIENLYNDDKNPYYLEEYLKENKKYQKINYM